MDLLGFAPRPPIAAWTGAGHVPQRSTAALDKAIAASEAERKAETKRRIAAGLIPARENMTESEFRPAAYVPGIGGFGFGSPPPSSPAAYVPGIGGAGFIPTRENMTVNYNYTRPGTHQTVAKRNAVRFDPQNDSRLYRNNRRSGGLDVVGALIELQGFGRNNLEETPEVKTAKKSNFSGRAIIIFLLILSLVYLWKDLYLNK